MGKNGKPMSKSSRISQSKINASNLSIFEAERQNTSPLSNRAAIAGIQRA